jgi:colicin import membrane protein
MSTQRLRDVLALLMLAAASPSAVAAPQSDAAQRERIARDRAVIEREAQATQKLCAQQFAVTDCVDRAKAERRQRLRPLERELAALDDAQRKRRAAERLAQIQQRQASQADVRPEVSVHKRKVAGGEQAGPVDAAAMAVEPQPRSSAQAAQSEAEAAKRAAASAKRTEQANAHRRVVEQRNAERARQGAPASSLPVPPAPPAPEASR